MIESSVMSSTESFRSRGTVDLIWTDVMDKLNDIIANTLQTTADTKIFLGLKVIIVNFIQSIEKYGFSVARISDSMANLYDSFTELMKSECTEKIIQVGTSVV
jgi:exocyst complex component 6